MTCWAYLYSCARAGCSPVDCADGLADEEVMLKASALQEYVLTCHTLRNPDLPRVPELR